MSDFRKVREQEIFQGYAIRVAVVDFEAPGGEAFSRDVVYAPGAVAIVPVDADGNVVFIRQYRTPIERLLLEIPAGMRDKPGEPPIETAVRELAEEVGLVAGSLEQLNVFYNAAGFSNHQTYVYLATDLSETEPNFDGVEEEYLTVERIPLASTPELIASGEICDSKTVVGVLLALRHLGG